MSLTGKTAGLVAILLLAAGCGSQRTLTINSEPSGALVYLNGEEIGRTPVKYDFESYGDYDVVLRKDGFETLKTHRDMKAPLSGIVPFDLFAELFGSKDIRQWTFDLAPAKPGSDDAQALISRAQAMEKELKSSPRTRKPATVPATQPAKE
jgi:hypothetical protein